MRIFFTHRPITRWAFQQSFSLPSLSARVSGWTAHVMEQRVNNRIIRPSADYIGEDPRSVVKIDER